MHTSSIWHLVFFSWTFALLVSIAFSHHSLRLFRYTTSRWTIHLTILWQRGVFSSLRCCRWLHSGYYTRSVIHLGSDIHCMLYKVAIFTEIALEQGQRPVCCYTVPPIYPSHHKSIYELYPK
ncbi:hypothetical protein BD769DRAFT_1510292 [Suillus cothurnatus]|nr:hypothetical protein BD769DRAFT_1510292 [Suillus cothurnatus]